MRKFLAGLAAALFAFTPVLTSAQTIGYSPNTLPLAGSCGTVVLSTPCFDVSQAWSGTATFTLDKANVSADPGPSNAASLLIDRQYLGVSKFSVRRDGIIFGAALQTTGDIVSTAGNLSVSSGQKLQWNSDTILARDAANTLALRNGVNGQTFNTYGTYTDASNYERLGLRWDGSEFALETQQAGTGSSRILLIGTNGSTPLTFKTNASSRWSIDTSGNFIPVSSNTYSIGTGGSLVKDIFQTGGWNLWAGGTNVGVTINNNAGSQGQLLIRDGNGSAGVRVQIGGASSSSPALMDSGTTLKVRLADNSADAPFTAAATILSGNLTFATDNSFNIGAISGASRPASIYAAGALSLSSPTTQSGTTYSLSAGDSALIFTNAGTATLTLQAASSFPGRRLIVKTTGGGSVISASSNVVPLAGGSAGTAILAATAGKWAELISDGTNWVLMEAN